MAIIPAIRTYLLADATVSGLIGARIHSSKFPQRGSFPAVRISRTVGERTHSTDGPSGLARVILQLDCYADDPGEADDVAEAIRKRLDGLKGTAGTVTVQGAFASDVRDGYDDEVKRYFTQFDYSVWFEEATS